MAKDAQCIHRGGFAFKDVRSESDRFELGRFNVSVFSIGEIAFGAYQENAGWI